MNFWNEGQLRLKGIHCIAEYNTQIVDENNGNPFIEAIPKRIGMEEFYDKLYSVPRHVTSSSNLTEGDRIELIRQIRPSFWLPFPSHYEKYLELYIMIKVGYQSRNPLTSMYNRQFALGWDRILEQGLNREGANAAGNIHTAQSIAEIGLSGMGKSKIYERMLCTLFPQVIHHREYKGRKLLTTQVVWLKIECPSGKSVGGLCRNFYDEVDKVLGSNFYEKHGTKNVTAEKMAKKMVQIAAQINLGVLIIDEIQNVHRAHSGGDQRLINFITELVNTIGIPVIIIGTFKAMYLFKNSLAVARRGIPDNYSENVTSFLLEDSWEWNEFIENLWELQYTPNFTPLSEELKQVMYFHTLGIPDITVKLFMHIQSKLILNGSGKNITVAHINSVASKSLRLLQPVFNLIRQSGGDTATLQKIEDVQPEWESFNDYLKQTAFKINLFGKIAKDHARANQQRNKDDIYEELMQFAENLVQNAEEAQNLANNVYIASNGMADKKSMFLEIARLATTGNNLNGYIASNKEVEKNSKKTKTVKPTLEESDIRFIVGQGLKKGLSTEESLIEAGIVKEYDEILRHIK